MSYTKMPRGNLSKVDMLAKVYKLKTELYDGTLEKKSEEYHEGAHTAYNTILDIINEYGN